MSPFLLGVSLSSWNRVLGRTLTLAYGEASGFFVFGLVHHIANNRGPNRGPTTISTPIRDAEARVRERDRRQGDRKCQRSSQVPSKSQQALFLRD